MDVDDHALTRLLAQHKEKRVRIAGKQAISHECVEPVEQPSADREVLIERALFWQAPGPSAPG